MYTVSDGLRTTRNKDGGIVLDVDHGQMFRLNPVGALILKLLAQGHSETEIAQKIARQYNIREEEAATDVREFLQSLAEHNLVRTERRERTL